MSSCCGKGSVEDLVNKFKEFQNSPIALKQHPHSLSQLKSPFISNITTTTSSQFKGTFTNSGFLKKN